MKRVAIRSNSHSLIALSLVYFAVSFLPMHSLPSPFLLFSTLDIPTRPSLSPFVFKQTPHSKERCRAHAACIATPSGNKVNTVSPSTRLHTGQNVIAVFSNDVLRKLTYSSLTSDRRTAANCLSIIELRLSSSNFVITTSMLSMSCGPNASNRLRRPAKRRLGAVAALPRR